MVYNISTITERQEPVMLPVLLTSFFSDWAHAWGQSIGGIALTVIGMVLIMIEIVIPGFGAAGISGGVALIAGLILGSAGNISYAMFSLLIVLAILIIFAVVVFRSALKGKLSRSPVVLNTSIDAGSTELFDEDMQNLIGKTGVTATALRPSGIAVIDGRRLDVVTLAEFIGKGEPVVVERVEGVKILVKHA